MRSRGADPHSNPKTPMSMIMTRGEECQFLYPHLREQLRTILLSCNAQKKQPQSQHPQTDRDQTNRDQPPPNQRTTTMGKKKKTGAGAEPRGRSRAWRTGRTRTAWPGRRDTRGIPNPKGVWVFPAPERKRKRKNGVDGNTQHKREREGTTNILADEGQVLKGAKPNNIPTPETKKYRTHKPNMYPEST